MNIYTTIYKARDLNIPIAYAARLRRDLIEKEIEKLSARMRTLCLSQSQETTELGQQLLSDELTKVAEQKLTLLKEKEMLENYWQYEEESKDKIDLDQVRQVPIGNFISKPHHISNGTAMHFSPLRDDGRHPSFAVSLQKNLWFDFVLGEGGDNIDLYMRIHHCSFVEAINDLIKL